MAGKTVCAVLCGMPDAICGGADSEIGGRVKDKVLCQECRFSNTAPHLALSPLHTAY